MKWTLRKFPISILLILLAVWLALPLPGSSGPRSRGLFGHSDPVRQVSQARSADPQATQRPCPLCERPLDVPIRQLTDAMADSVGRVYSSFNRDLFAWLDSLYQAGQFGDPGNRESRRRAHVMSRLLALNSMHYMVGFATDPDHVWEANEATVREAFRKYSDPGIYPIVRMSSARMGMGNVCVRYDVSTDMESTVTVGSKQLSVSVQESDFDGVPRRVLIMKYPTLIFGDIQIVVDDHFTCKAELRHGSGPPAPHDVYMLYDMQGVEVRKWGVHRPGAMLFWSTPRDLQRGTLPPLPLVGSAVYVPRVQLELPSILPDMSFDDLRLIDLPQPIFERSYVQKKKYPAWLERAEPRGFKGWDSVGPIPPDLQLRFPDL